MGLRRRPRLRSSCSSKNALTLNRRHPFERYALSNRSTTTSGAEWKEALSRIALAGVATALLALMVLQRIVRPSPVLVR